MNAAAIKLIWFHPPPHHHQYLSRFERKDVVRGEFIRKLNGETNNSERFIHSGVVDFTPRRFVMASAGFSVADGTVSMPRIERVNTNRFDGWQKGNLAVLCWISSHSIWGKKQFHWIIELRLSVSSSFHPSCNTWIGFLWREKEGGF